MRFSRLAAPLLAAVLVACASGPAERDHFYRLQVPDPGVRRAEPVLAGVVEVDRPRADHLVRERPLLRSEGDAATEVTPYTYHLWVDSPTTMVQRELVRWLEASGAAGSAVLPEAGVRERWLVTGTLERMEHLVASGEVLVVLELRVKDQRGGSLLLQERYSGRAPAPGGPSSAVPAFGKALAGVFERFVADVASAR